MVRRTDNRQRQCSLFIATGGGDDVSSAGAAAAGGLFDQRHTHILTLRLLLLLLPLFKEEHQWLLGNICLANISNAIAHLFSDCSNVLWRLSQVRLHAKYLFTLQADRFNSLTHSGGQQKRIIDWRHCTGRRTRRFPAAYTNNIIDSKFGEFLYFILSLKAFSLLCFY